MLCISQVTFVVCYSSCTPNITHVLQPCQHLEDKQDGSAMLCRMPFVSLPDDLSEQLNQSESGTINNTQGPGVAVYWASNGSTRADIYIGLKLDGLKRFQNISAVDSSIKMQFALKPAVFCEYSDVTFRQHRDTVISIKVNRLYFAVKWMILIKYMAHTLVNFSLIVSSDLMTCCSTVSGVNGASDHGYGSTYFSSLVFWPAYKIAKESLISLLLQKLTEVLSSKRS